MADENKDPAQELLDELSKMDKIGTVDSELSSSEEESGEESEESSTENEEGKSTDGEETAGEEDKDEEKTPEEETTANKEDETDKESDKSKGESSEKTEEISREDKLLAEIDRLSGLLDSKVDLASTIETEDKDDSLEKLAEDFIGDLDMDDVSSDPKVFNKILLSVIKKAVELSDQKSSKRLENAVPLAVKTQVKQYTGTKDAIDEFYKNNPDLSNVRKVVKACASQIVDENPEMKWENILNKAAEKTRQTLGIEKQSTGEKVGDLGDAAFAESKKHNRDKKKDNRTSQQKQIDEL